MRATNIARPRLLNQLNHAVSSDGTIHPKLTLITAPAGYGKSTLTTQWVSQLNRSVAWLSLDAGDNDEARFLAYLFAALATVHEEVGEAAQARLTTTYLYNDTEAILTALLNDLSAGSETVVIVLDDYHLITDGAIHQAMTFILQHMPVQLHLVIAGRAEPPLPIALLRAQGTLNWVNARDLRFTNEEAALFLSQTMGVTLSDSQIARLDEQVEGWVTGLQLVGLALQEQVAFLGHGALQAAFSGSQRYLVDYLADQVLSCQPADIQEFLLRTAVLTQFNTGLCNALTGRDSHTQLAHVEAANLFLIPLDPKRQWFRYHHLFADFLLGRLQQRKSAAEIAQLHRRAAEWYHQNGQSLIAVEHALEAEDYELAVTLILEVARQVLMFGEGITLRQWVERLPEAMQTTSPDLVLYHVWSLIRTGDFARATTLLESISDRLDTRRLFGEYAALRARLAVMTGDTEINIQFSQKALHKLPDDDHMLRGEVAINLGFSHLQKSDLEAARDAFAEAAQNTAHDPGLWAVMFATFYWGETYERQANLTAAFDIYRQGLALSEAQTNGRQASPAAGFMHVGLGKILYEWNRLAEAEGHLRRALELAQRCGDHKMLIYSREAMAQLLTTLDDWPGAQAILDDLEKQIQSPGPSTLRAILALQHGDLVTAERWKTAQNLSLEDTAEKIEQLPFTYLTLARLHLQRRQYDGLQSLLACLETIGEEREKLQFLTSVYLVRALLYARQGAITEAMPCFQRALTLAERGGYIRTVLNHQEPSLTRLLHLAASKGLSHAQNSVTAAFARTLLAHFDPQETAEGPNNRLEVQPLSPRELEVLQYLAAGLTNREIAERLVVTINTVKAHTRRLYAKLDVGNRTQAVARGRECSLL
jgi:LuxR family maltose regulon positive regulatory protein